MTVFTHESAYGTVRIYRLPSIMVPASSFFREARAVPQFLILEADNKATTVDSDDFLLGNSGTPADHISDLQGVARRLEPMQLPT